MLLQKTSFVSAWKTEGALENLYGIILMVARGGAKGYFTRITLTNVDHIVGISEFEFSKYASLSYSRTARTRGKGYQYFCDLQGFLQDISSYFFF